MVHWEPGDNPLDGLPEPGASLVAHFRDQNRLGGGGLPGPNRRPDAVIFQAIEFRARTRRPWSREQVQFAFDIHLTTPEGIAMWRAIWDEVRRRIAVNAGLPAVATVHHEVTSSNTAGNAVASDAKLAATEAEPATTEAVITRARHVMDDQRRSERTRRAALYFVAWAHDDFAPRKNGKAADERAAKHFPGHPMLTNTRQRQSEAWRDAMAARDNPDAFEL